MSRARGRHWEIVADRWLRERRVRILGRNYRCRAGEIDLIVRDGEQIAFVEVKFRSRSGYGSGADHVTHAKRQRLIRTARHFIQYHRHPPSQVFRFDVISISDQPDGAEIQWIKNAFEAV